MTRGVEFDFIVVGAGSAGCVVARNLSDDETARVLVLEAGGSDRSWKIKMPSAYAYPLSSRRFNWMLRTEPQKCLDNRRIDWPAGKVLGGSSSINGMVYIRGNAGDYAGWEKAGAAGWSYGDVLPYFKRAENRVRGPNRFHGDRGPLSVSGPTNHTPLYDAFIQAGQEAGFPKTEDFNGAQQEGFGNYEMTVRNGERHSAYSAYLKPALARKNLRVETGVRVLRVLMKSGRVYGVEYSRNGQIHTATATKEVILSAGAIHTPKLLMLSGIGTAEHLGKFGIKTEVDLPGVGQNLQDHLELYVQFVCREPVTLYPYLAMPRKALAGVRWYLNRSGICATNHAEAGAFIKSNADAEYPNIQFHFVPLAIDYHGRSPVNGHSFQVHVGPGLPTSRGEIRLRSRDPMDSPLIDPRYNSTEHDRAAMRECIRLTRHIISQNAIAKYAGPEIAPGVKADTDAELDAFVRRTAESGYHYAGTCRMGSDEMAVTDPSARVRGVDGLRIADASLMPRIVNGNTNAVAIMIGEKVSDLIRDKKIPQA